MSTKPTNDDVICPACGGLGSKKRYVNPHKSNVIPCLACRRTGRVAAERVCQHCGKFIDMCTCSVGERNVESKTLGDYGMVAAFVGYVERDQQHVAYAKINGKPVYLAGFKDEALALQMAKEAEGLRVDQLDDLRAKYRDIRKGLRRQALAQVESIVELAGEPASEPAANPTSEPEPTKQIAQSNLLALLQIALAADQDMQRTCKDAQHAEQVAIDAWNAVAEALRDTAGPDSAFVRSEFGSILLEMQS